MSYVPAAIVLFLISVVAFVLSALSYHEKGPLLNYTYYYAPKKRRTSLKKSPFYRQSAVIFLLGGIAFALIALEFLFMTDWLLLAAFVVLASAAIYASWTSRKIRPNWK